LIDRVGAIELAVSDLERSIAFYRDGLRFSIETRCAEPSDTVHLRAGSVHLALVAVAPGRPRHRSVGISVTVEVSGVDAYYDALVARGLLPSPPKDGGGRRHFSIRDPDGYNWTFVQALD
jgi:catechol 2,3-dioxygenase-like lactoylglutathione lyase family enzyme